MAIISQSKIPQGCFNELNKTFSKVDFNNYGQSINDNVVTRKLEYRDVEKTNLPKTVNKILCKDNGEFETIESILDNAVVIEGYMVRGIIEGNSIKVYQIQSTGQVIVNENDYNAFEL